MTMVDATVITPRRRFPCHAYLVTFKFGRNADFGRRLDDFIAPPGDRRLVGRDRHRRSSSIPTSRSTSSAGASRRPAVFDEDNDIVVVVDHRQPPGARPRAVPRQRPVHRRAVDGADLGGRRSALEVAPQRQPSPRSMRPAADQILAELDQAATAPQCWRYTLLRKAGEVLGVAAFWSPRRAIRRQGMRRSSPRSRLACHRRAGLAPTASGIQTARQFRQKPARPIEVDVLHGRCARLATFDRRAGITRRPTGA